LLVNLQFLFIVYCIAAEDDLCVDVLLDFIQLYSTHYLLA